MNKIACIVDNLIIAGIVCVACALLSFVIHDVFGYHEAETAFKIFRFIGIACWFGAGALIVKQFSSDV